MQFNIGRRFVVHRAHDPSGVSGTGIVAEGIQFHDGQVVVSWFGKHHIFECPRSMKTWLRVHGHGGVTCIKWVDTKKASRYTTSTTSSKKRKRT